MTRTLWATLLTLSMAWPLGAARADDGKPSGGWTRPDEPFRDGEKVFREARDLLAKEYVDPKLNDEKLWRSATMGLFANDGNGQWDRLLSPTELAELNSDLTGEMVGLGIQISTDEQTGVTTIDQVVPNTPAAKSGLKSGDQILKVDGKAMRGMDEQAVRHNILGPAGKPVTLLLLRDTQVLTRTVVRARFVFEPITEVTLPGGVALIDVRMFTGKTPAMLKTALEHAKAASARAIVLDLRENPGGLFERMLDCAGLMLPKGSLVVTSLHRGGAPEEKRTATEPVLSGVPTAVLVDHETASSAEMLAAALGAQGAHIVGKRTRGKWNAQKLVELSNGWAAKLTIAWFRTPSGAMLDGKGLEPDVEVEMDSKTTDRVLFIREPSARLAADAQLRSAVNLLKLAR